MELHQATGEAFQRAKLDPNAEEKGSLCNKMKKAPGLSVVKLLLGGTKAFPGDPLFQNSHLVLWYAKSKFSKNPKETKCPVQFTQLVEKMEKKIEAFEWASWKLG